MASLDFLQLVTERLEIVLVGIEDGAVKLNSTTVCALLIAAIWP